jgi:hypothetical protein
VLLNLVKPYRKVTLRFLAKELSLTEKEIEKILIYLIIYYKILVATNDKTSRFIYFDGNKVSNFTDQQYMANLRFIDTLMTLSDSLLEAQS